MASIAGITASPNLPYQDDIRYAQASATGTINPGDWLAYSGSFVLAQFSGNAPGTAYWKTSGAGMAIDSNPVYDQYGNSVLNSAMRILVEGTVWVTGAASGVPLLGMGAYPVSTGSGVGAPTGKTGVGATWQTAQVINGSAYSGTANAQRAPVGTVLAGRNFSNAGTGEWLVRLMALAPDVRG
jgi:hypothetical protein